MTNEQLISHLSKIVTPERYELFKKNVSERTRYGTIVIEDLYQPHNISAVLRSCDCFGIQDVHVIENRCEFEENPDIAVGSSKWLTINRYKESENNTQKTLKQLKSEGYRIVATTPHTDDVILNDFDVTKGKFALVFGNEKEGISEEVKEIADEFLRIPMYGFTESFNISVSAALCLQYVANELRNQDIDWQLPSSEKEEILLSWLRKSIKNADQIEKRLIENK
jgi:tRNA (guanosine-2'-O-)-methyltransferase